MRTNYSSYALLESEQSYLKISQLLSIITLIVSHISTLRTQSEKFTASFLIKAQVLRCATMMNNVLYIFSGFLLF